MQSRVALILLYSMITLVQTLYGKACGCTFCTDTTTISAGSKRQIYNPQSCPAGTAAAVSELKVQSTDGSGFKVYTKDDPSSSEYYPDASTTSTATCFNMGDGFVVGVRYPRIYVIISCEEWIQSCDIRYTVDLVCRRVETTSTTTATSRFPSTTTATSRSTSAVISTTLSTTQPISPSTATAVVYENICECQCCKGSSTCNPVYVGLIRYGTKRCQPSDCTTQCLKQFSACPASGIELGKIVTQCRNNIGTGLKTSFYISLLGILSLYILCIA